MTIHPTQLSSFYDFQANDLSGNKVSLQQFKGKVLLVVNTASECGFTPQYTELEALYQQFREQGFEVLAFPSDDFGEQEPLDGEALEKFCRKDYSITFPVFQKVRVKGVEAHSLFCFLADKKKNVHSGGAPKWNFHKYLIDREGNLVTYFFPFTSPQASRVKKAIRKLL